MTQHALIVHFRYGSADLTRLFELEDRIEDAIESAGVGRFDGDLVASDGCDGYLYMYGADADRMLDVVGSSRVDLQACKLEYSIVSPK